MGGSEIGPPPPSVAETAMDVSVHGFIDMSAGEVFAKQSEQQIHSKPSETMKMVLYADGKYVVLHFLHHGVFTVTRAWQPYIGCICVRGAICFQMLHTFAHFLWSPHTFMCITTPVWHYLLSM